MQANTNGIEIKIIVKKIKMFLNFEKIWNLKINKKKEIAKTTGIADGLDANKKKL